MLPTATHHPFLLWLLEQSVQHDWRVLELTPKLPRTWKWTMVSSLLSHWLEPVYNQAVKTAALWEHLKLSSADTGTARFATFTVTLAFRPCMPFPAFWLLIKLHFGQEWNPASWPILPLTSLHHASLLLALLPALALLQLQNKNKPIQLTRMAEN